MKKIRNLQKTILNTLIAGTLLFLTDGCVEPFAPSVSAIDHNFLVVDGFLVGNDSTFIRLSRSQVISDTSRVQPEPHATVQIEVENGSTYWLTEQAAGLYVAPPLDLESHRNYRIRIRTNEDKEYLSDFVPLKPSPPLDSITLENDLEHDVLKFNIAAHDPQNDTHYYYWTYDETFYYVSAAQSWYYYENGEMLPRKHVNELYECWKTNNTVNYKLHSTIALSADVVHNFNLVQVPQAARKLYFSYSILVKQYALTESAYEYWRLTKINTETLGSLFDPTPSQTLSNIVCLTDPTETVIGHFNATTVQKKRVFITREDIEGPSGPYDPTGYESCETAIVPLGNLSEETLRGKIVIDPHHFPFTNILIGYKVMSENCGDCRKRGGVNIKPDYWE